MKRGPYTVLSTRGVYENPWIKLREDAVIHPGGREGIFGIITMVPGSTVLPLADNGDVYLVEEYCYGIDRLSLEAISGALDADEPPLQAAHRELKEETGLTAVEMIALGTIDPFTTAVDSPNHLFLARGLTEGEASPEDSEQIKLVRIPLREALNMAMSGGITHGATVALILKTALLLDQKIN